MDIYNNFKEIVVNGYFSRLYNGGWNYVLWKNYFCWNFCNFLIYEDCNVI